jgi:hypothetical protein
VGEIVQIRPSISVGEGNRKFGYNPAVTVPADVIYAGGFQTWLTTAAAGADIDIVSDDPADNPAGAGAKSIYIDGLDADYKEQSEVVTLDGVNDVHPKNAYIRIYRAEIRGPDANIGTITIDVGGTDILARIPPAFGQTVQAAYTIPADYRAGWLLSYDVNVANKATSQFAVVQLRVKPFGQACLVKEIFQVSSDQGYIYKFSKPFKIEAKSDVYLRVIDSSAANLPVAGGFELYLER